MNSSLPHVCELRQACGALRRDVDPQVLARAVKLHAQTRVFPKGSTTVAFTSSFE